MVEHESESRQRILHAAISVVEATGEASLRVDRVAAMAGYTKPVIYYHFGDREGLIVAVQVERYLQGLNVGFEGFSAAVEACETLEDFIAVVRGWMSTFDSPEGVERRRIRMEVLGSAVSRPRLRDSVNAANRHYMESLGRMFTIARDRGWLAVDFPSKDLALWITGVVLGRHLADTDPAFVDATVHDRITDQILIAMFTGRPLGAEAGPS